MANLEAALNGYKRRIYTATIDATLEATSTALANTPTIANTQHAFTILRQGPAVFAYLNDPHVNALGGASYARALRGWQLFDRLYGLANPGVTPTNMAGLWTTFTNFLSRRIVSHHRRYLDLRLDQLGGPWIAIQNSPTSTAMEQLEATTALALVALFRSKIDTAVAYDRSRFV